MANKIQIMLVLVLLTAVFSLMIALFIPARLPLAFDWLTFFADPRNIPDFYPPWTCYACSSLTWPLLIGLTLSTYTVAVMKRAQSLASAAAAFFAMPLWWCLFLGQLDGLALLGVLGLPWLAPLALMKPQIAGFAILASRKSLMVTVGFLALSLAIWGLWPAKMLTYHQGQDEWLQDVGLGLYGLPPAILTLWLVPGWGVDKLMLAGAFITPALIPYQLLPLMPAVAYLPWWLAWIAALSSWLPVTANWVGPWGWWLMWVSVALIGVGLMRHNGRLRA